jgi:hypothetical protein
MKPRLAAAAAKRIAVHRRLQIGALATAQKGLWDALMRGDMNEAKRQRHIVVCIRGPQPPSPLADVLIERLNRLRVGYRIIRGEG